MMDMNFCLMMKYIYPVSYTHLRAHETGRNLVCRLLLEKKKKTIDKKTKKEKKEKKQKDKKNKYSLRIRDNQNLP